MKHYKITCAKFLGVYRSKSNWYYKLEYQIDKNWIVSSRQGRTYHVKIEEYLDTVKCMKIAYSKSDVHIIRILDEKVGDEWLWFLDAKDK